MQTQPPSLFSIRKIFLALMRLVGAITLVSNCTPDVNAVTFTVFPRLRHPDLYRLNWEIGGMEMSLVGLGFD